MLKTIRGMDAQLNGEELRLTIDDHVHFVGVIWKTRKGYKARPKLAVCRKMYRGRGLRFTTLEKAATWLVDMYSYGHEVLGEAPLPFKDDR